ncbi:MAG: tetratricopeptide repeat protein [Candidatus Accumulibacter sp.]|jgi:tetratricopeptide (TPR) repeat protein|nr:tetratricopeptide repeat protein [Accumulibacter sp.]
MNACNPEPSADQPDPMKRAARFFESREFAEAERLAREICTVNPTDENALRFLAQAVYEQGRLEEAVGLIGDVLKLNPIRAAYHNDFGAMLAALKRWPDAEAAYRMAKVLDPHNPDASFNLAIALSNQNKNDDALRELESIENAQPDFADACALRGKILLSEKRYDEAADAFSKAIECGLDTPDIHAGLGVALLRAGRRKEAFVVLFESGKIDPENAQMNCCMGELMREKDELAKARGYFEKALEIDPSLAVAYNNLGIIFEMEGDFLRAEAEYSRAVEFNPEMTPAYVNLGNCQNRRGQREDARASFQRAIALDPDGSSGWNNLALLFYGEQRFDEAEGAFQQALSADPDSAQVKFNYGLMRLALGDFEAGWEDYEQRHALKAKENKGAHPSHAKFDCPEWKGEALDGKSLFVDTEQGLGDNIQFVRYFAALRARYPNARLFFRCLSPLTRLFALVAAKYSVTLIVNTVQYDENKANGDFFVPLMSLPRHLAGARWTIPTDVPYLSLPDAFISQWSARLSGISALGGKKVGLVWSGSEGYGGAGRRNMMLSQFVPLFEIPGISWVSLQKLPKSDARGEIDAEGLSAKIFDPMPEVKDFADTAAIVANLDLVISVDTAVLHLAGAMGVPVWLMNRFDTDWRWEYDCSDSLWYPTMRIFRQKAFGEWAPVVTEAADALKKWVGADAREATWALLKPQRADAAFNVALALSREGKTDEALRVLDILEKKHPEFAWQFALRGKIYRAEARAKDAVEALSRAVALGVEAPSVVTQLGLALADAGLDDEAFKVLAESGKAIPEDPAVNHCLGVLLTRRGKTDEARRFFEMAIVADPTFMEALGALGELLRATGDLAGADAAFTRRDEVAASRARYRVALEDYAATIFGLDH